METSAGAPERTYGREGLPPAVWVLLVILIGVVAGVALYLASPGLSGGPMGRAGACGFRPGGCPSAPSAFVLVLGEILSTTTFVLLLALLFHFTQMYRQTHARMMLGWVVFLLALVVGAAATSPFVLVTFGGGIGGLGGFLALERFSMCAALTVFLYLSLE